MRTCTRGAYLQGRRGAAFHSSKNDGRRHARDHGLGVPQHGIWLPMVHRRQEDSRGSCVRAVVFQVCRRRALVRPPEYVGTALCATVNLTAHFQAQCPDAPARFPPRDSRHAMCAVRTLRRRPTGRRSRRVALAGTRRSATAHSPLCAATCTTRRSSLRGGYPSSPQGTQAVPGGDPTCRSHVFAPQVVVLIHTGTRTEMETACRLRVTAAKYLVDSMSGTIARQPS